VVVAVGLTLLEPFAELDVKVPGVMLMLVAPEVAQLRLLLAPEVMLAGFATKEVIVGREEFPPGEFDAPPQPTSSTHADRRRISMVLAIYVLRLGMEKIDESCDPSDFMTKAAGTVAVRGSRPLGHVRQGGNTTLAE
jgi:hypothetical protein